MNIYLCGYHKIGCEVLKYLMTDCKINNKKPNVAVFTHNPKMPHIPNVIDVAKKYNVWYTTKSINKIKAPFEPDIIASVYYRNIIKKNILDKAKIGTFNIHPSLLPKHRGCSSVPWAIISNDKQTGVTFHNIDEGIDTGNIILQIAIQISPEDTQKSLFEKCMIKGAEYFPYALNLVIHGFSGIPQEGISNYNKRGVPYDGTIENFIDNYPVNEPITYEAINRYIRAMTYPPYPYATFNGVEVKNLNDFLKLYLNNRSE